MNLKFFSLFIFLTLYSFGQKLQLTKNAKIGIITVAPGKDLNDTWGHNAIRVKDAYLDLDIVYNYGTYDFNTPNFYTKFMRGKLLYDLGINDFYHFYKYYSQHNRSVIEQELNLNQDEKQLYFNYLQNNALPKNKKYLYDFFFDNCATRLRLVTDNILKDRVIFNDKMLNKNYTFRDLIYTKLENHPWGKFGIDTALGSVIDKKAKPKEYTFLPSYVYENFKTAKIKRNDRTEPLIKKEIYLFKQKKTTTEKSFFTPVILFSVLFLIVLLITYYDLKKEKKSKILDFIILFSTGLVGLIVILLWFATDHTTTKNNFNIFWAFFPNVYFAFYVFKTHKNHFLKKYYLFLILLLIIGIILWFLKIQIFNLALIPISLILFVRYFYNYSTLK